MARSLNELLKNINFSLRLAECIACLVGVILSIIQGGNVYNYWFVHGWFMVSLAYVVAYFFEKPNVWLEVGLIISYIIDAFGVFYYFTTEDVVSVIVVILMIIDLIFLIMNRNK